MRTLLSLALLLALTACAEPVAVQYRIVCYSGGEVVFQDDTDFEGIATFNSGTAYVFTSAYSGTWYRVPSSSCIVNKL